MTGRILLFGATGYTGTLVAETLVKGGARPVLAGRSPEKLEQLAVRLGGLETHVADVSEPASIRAALGPGDVLVSTVGPFLRWGDAAVAAAVNAGAHYLDSTGEPAFIRKVFAHYGSRASTSSSALMTASGFDWVPGNLAGALALTAAGAAATRVELSYLLAGPGAESGGARASTAAALLEPSFAYRGGRVVSQRTAARTRRVRIENQRPRWVLSAGGTEHLALPERFPHLRDIEVGLGLYGATVSNVAPVASAAVSAGMRFPPIARTIRRVVERAAKGSTGGPSDDERAAGTSKVIARAYSAKGELLHSTTLAGVEGFTFTANFLAWAAARVAAGNVQAVGALGPVQAFGIDALIDGVQRSGLSSTLENPG